MRKQKNPSTVRLRSPRASRDQEQKEILQKLSTLENLLKKKDDKPLTFKEACAYLGYAPSYLYKLTYRKVIPHYKPTGKIIFFSKAELDEWVYKGNVKLRIENVELKEEKNIEKDPNQIEMGFEEQKTRRNEEKMGNEIVVEFPRKKKR